MLTIYLASALSGLGSLYKHRSQAFHIRYLEWLCEQRAVEIDAACTEDENETTGGKIPVFSCTGLGDKLEFLNPNELLNQLPQALNNTCDNILSFRKSRYDQLVRGGRRANGSPPTEDERLVGGVFKHDPKSTIHLLVLVKRNEGGYEARYSAFYIL